MPGDRPDADHPGLDRPGSQAGGGSPPPDFPAARQHVRVELLRFVADLRADGVAVPASGPLDAASALASVGLGDRDRADAALRATLLSAPGDGEVFAEHFPAFWHRLRSGLVRIATAGDGPSASADESDESPGEAGDDRATSADEADTLAAADAPETDPGGDGEVQVRIPTGRRHAAGERAAAADTADARRYSAVGGSQPVDAGRPDLAPDETAAVERFVDALSSLPGRRRRRDAAGTTVDARRALRSSLATGGVPLALPRTDAVESELRCCLLVDVSGSVLDTVDRDALLALGERLVADARSARVFLFDTDLTEATEAFARAEGDPGTALREAAVEWGGGTRIGGAFESLRRETPHAVDRRTVVVVVSDGLDTGDPDRLRAGVTWLSRRAAAVVWLNPLAVSPQYEPTARGMATALPYLDALVGFAEAADLARAADRIERRGLAGLAGPSGWQPGTAEEVSR